MMALALVFAVTASPAPAAACVDADIAVTDLQLRVIKPHFGRSGPDRLIFTTVLANVGSKPQPAGTTQHVELLRDGKVIGTESLEVLGPSENNTVAFRIFRPRGERSDPLQVTVRYVLDSKREGERANCAAANDSLQKIF